MNYLTINKVLIIILSTLLLSPNYAYSDENNKQIKTINNDNLYSKKALNYLAYKYLDMKDYSKAVFYFSRLVKGTDDFYSRRYYAESLYFLGKHNEAINELNNIIKNTKDDVLCFSANDLLNRINSDKKIIKNTKNEAHCYSIKDSLSRINSNKKYINTIPNTVFINSKPIQNTNKFNIVNNNNDSPQKNIDTKNMSNTILINSKPLQNTNKFNIIYNNDSQKKNTDIKNIPNTILINSKPIQNTNKFNIIYNNYYLPKKNIDTKKNKINNNHYLCDTTYKVFVRRWEKENMPLKVYVTTPNFKLSESADKYVNLVKNSLKKWSNASPNNIKFQYTNSKKDANLVIQWDYSLNTTITTPPTYYKDINKKISYINIPFKYYDYSYSLNDLDGMIIHEIGHALGLSHSNNILDVMYYGTNNNEITQRDKKSLELFYSIPNNTSYSCKEDKIVYDNIPQIPNNITNPYFLDLRNKKEENHLCNERNNIENNFLSDGKSYFVEHKRWDEKDMPLKVYISLPVSDKLVIKEPEHFKFLVKEVLDDLTQKLIKDVPQIATFKIVENEKDANIVIKLDIDINSGMKSHANINKNKYNKIILFFKINFDKYGYSSKIANESLKKNILKTFIYVLGDIRILSIKNEILQEDSITQRDINTIKLLYSVPPNYSFLCTL